MLTKMGSNWDRRRTLTRRRSAINPIPSESPPLLLFRAASWYGLQSGLVSREVRFKSGMVCTSV